MAASATTSLNLFPIQYRTFDRIYTVNKRDPASGGGLSLKVLNVAQQRLAKITVFEEEITQEILGEETSALLGKAIEERNPVPLFRILFEKEILPKASFGDLTRSILPQESSPIEAKKGSLENITESLQTLITKEKEKVEEEIATTALFKEEKQPIADQLSRTVDLLIEAEQYEDALNVLVQAFHYTKKWNPLEKLPLLYEKLGAPDKAYLATLHLALYQLEAGDTALAVKTFEEKILPKEGEKWEEVLLLASIHRFLGDIPRALERLSTTPDHLGEEREEWITLGEDFVAQNPCNYGTYSSLEKLMSTEERKVALLVKGALDALHKKDEEVSRTLFEKAKEISSTLSPLDHQIEFQRKGLLQEEKKDSLRRELETLQGAYSVSDLETPFRGRNLQSTHNLLQKLSEGIDEKQILRTNFLRALASPAMSPPARTTPSLAFGAAEWNRYIGDVGVEPSLPPDIESILSAPCPFFPGKTVAESHILVLVPQTVNGNPFTLDSLNELSQAPKEDSGGHTTKYDDYGNAAKRELGPKPAPASHWVLFTRDVIPGTRNKTFSNQRSLLNTKKGALPYEVPTILDATTAVVMHYVKTGEKLYPRDPWTFTHCIEEMSGYRIACGGFGGGVRVHADYGYGHDNIGLGGCRKF